MQNVIERFESIKQDASWYVGLTHEELDAMDIARITTLIDFAVELSLEPAAAVIADKIADFMGHFAGLLEG